MDKFLTLTAVAAPMPAANINTDDIFPAPTASPILRKPENAALLTDRTKMGPNAFAVRRWHDDGSPRPDFVLNRPPWTAAQILITGENFGCGSSREMAVWCLQGIGIRCLVGSTFGDIFRNNCFRNGVLVVSLPASTVASLLELAAGDSPLFTIDLQNEAVTDPTGFRHRFQTPPYNRQALLEGLDEIEATLRKMAQIEAFENRYRAERAWLAATGTSAG